MQPEFVFSSESVTAGHPDKLCDQVSDALVDRYLRQDRRARVVAECAVSTGIVFLSIKAHSAATVDAAAAAREVLRDVGYARDGGFDARGCTVVTSYVDVPGSTVAPLDEEALDDAAIEAVDAREQATVFGFACDDTPQHMPLPIVLAHTLAARLSAQQAEVAALSPDGKTQVAIEYRDHRPARIDGITVVAAQHEPDRPSVAELEELVRGAVIAPAFAELPLRPDARTRIAVNPEGPVVPGGPALHAGLTGRKTAVDSYGDFGRCGAHALSGKDPSRIDRIATYAARHAARHLVAAGLARRCEVQLSYSIGLPRPVSVMVSTFGTSARPERELAALVARAFDLRPAGIVRRFGLRSLPARRGGTFYRALAAYGQVGRTDLDLPWERLDRLDALL